MSRGILEELMAYAESDDSGMPELEPIPKLESIPKLEPLPKLEQK